MITYLYMLNKIVKAAQEQPLSLFITTELLAQQLHNLVVNGFAIVAELLVENLVWS